MIKKNKTKHKNELIIQILKAEVYLAKKKSLTYPRNFVFIKAHYLSHFGWLPFDRTLSAGITWPTDGDRKGKLNFN